MSEQATERVEPATEQADETVEQTEQADTPQEGDKPEEFDAKRAQEKIRKANSEAAGLRRRIKELEPLAQKAREIQDAQKTTEERLQGELEAERQWRQQLTTRAVRSEVRAFAAEAFRDPTDAEVNLDLAAYIGDDGDIDSEQIKADLADLLQRKPHLAKPVAEPERRRPAPDRTQASSANASRSSAPADEFAGFITSRLPRRR